MNSSKPKRIVLAGGSGFLGSILSDHFSAAGWEIIVLTRKQKGSQKAALWDGKTLGPWTEQLEGADALVNLSGRSINCRFTPHNRKEILDSRVDSTRILGQAIARFKKPPAIWLNCSGAGIYNESFDKSLDESDTTFTDAQTGKSFSGQVALQWECALNEAQTPLTRKVALRISMVLGTRKDTPFRMLRRLAKAGLAGKMGGGKQYVSWIHETDFCRIMDWIIHRPELQGPVNVTAPNPCPNTDFMRTLRHACGRSIGLPAAAWMLEIGAFVMRTETELILDSRRVVPTRLAISGFQFRFPELKAACDDLEARAKMTAEL
jgi:uncharacterized protein (TIGR01777 family)